MHEDERKSERPLVVGAFSLASVDFLAPLYDRSRAFHVLVLPPFDLHLRDDYLDNADAWHSRGYLTLRIPASHRVEHLELKDATAAVASLQRWSDLAEQRLVELSCKSAVTTWRARSSLLIADFGDRLSARASTVRPEDVVVDLLRSLYSISRCCVTVTSNNGAFRLPLSRSDNPEAYAFLKECLRILVNAAGRPLRDRAALLMRPAEDKPWSALRMCTEVDTQTFSCSYGLRNMTPLFLSVTEDLISSEAEFGNTQVEFRPTGALKSLLLSSYGIPAHVPWYQRDDTANEKVAWKADAIVFVHSHQSLSSRSSRPPDASSGSYYWDSVAERASVSNLREVALRFWGSQESESFEMLTLMAQAIRGPRCRRQTRDQARGFVVREWKVLVHWAAKRGANSSHLHWSALDAIRFALLIWSALRHLRRVCFERGSLSLDELKPLLGIIGKHPSDALVRFTSAADLLTDIRKAYPDLVQFSVTSVSEPRSLTATAVRRATRGWLEIVSSLIDAFWASSRGPLAAELSSVVLLSNMGAVVTRVDEQAPRGSISLHYARR